MAMKRYFTPLFCSVLAVIGMGANSASAQRADRTVEEHIEIARAAAYRPGQDMIDVFETLCRAAMSEEGPQEPGLQVAPSLAERRVPPRSEWYAEPGEVFDNLYYVGSNNDSIWAVTTSEGIIVVDTGYDYSVEELTDGLKQFGLDPADIKYVVLSHAHGDRYFGAKFLQDTYGARVVMTEADWETMAKSNEPNELKARKDMIATDGMTLTLGDMTLTLYVTPGHTPGTISTLIPGLRDGNETHVGIVWGGMNPSFERYGIQYYATLAETFKTWSDSIWRFKDIADRAGADVYLAIHAHYDRTLDKLRALKYRRPGDPHAFVSKDAVDRFLTIMGECTDAQLGRVMAR
jgi:metallo-beta-lactamase class B